MTNQESEGGAWIAGCGLLGLLLLVGTGYLFFGAVSTSGPVATGASGGSSTTPVPFVLEPVSLTPGKGGMRLARVRVVVQPGWTLDEWTSPGAKYGQYGTQVSAIRVQGPPKDFGEGFDLVYELPPAAPLAEGAPEPTLSIRMTTQASGPRFLSMGSSRSASFWIGENEIRKQP